MKLALILIVDDSSTMRKAIVKVVKAEGYSTLEAADGREGLEIVATHAPDCILLDLIMPEVDGLEVLKALRERGSKIPVVVLTADIQHIISLRNTREPLRWRVKLAQVRPLSSEFLLEGMDED